MYNKLSNIYFKSNTLVHIQLSDPDQDNWSTYDDTKDYDTYKKLIFVIVFNLKL
jgi:hypothetical protein